MIVAIAAIGTWYLLDQPSSVWFKVVALAGYWLVLLTAFIKCSGTDHSEEGT